MKLRIIHTNDVHSQFENLSKAVSVIEPLINENTILLEAGDFADFKSIELQGTKGKAAVELLEAVGYEALTIGNNEMFNGMDTLEYMADVSSVPFISNNLLKADGAHINGLFSSTIIHKERLRILVTGSSPDLRDFNEGLGIRVKDYKTALKQEIRRNAGAYDICIVLNHIGTEADETLAEELPEIDIIISAHDHNLYKEAKVVNGVIMNSAGHFAEHVGVVDVEINNNEVQLVDSHNLSTDSAKRNEEILSILKANKEIAMENLSHPLYYLHRPLWHDVIEENPLTNLIADGLKEILDCDLSLMNSGIVNAGLFEYVSEQKLIEICPSPLNPTVFEVKGKDLLQALEHSLDSQVCLSDGKGPGFRGKYAGRLHVSGAVVIHNNQKILDVQIGRERLIEDRWYTVASSDYLQRGSGYSPLACNRNESYTPGYIRDVIRTYAENEVFLEKAFENRWVKNI
ncbi:bifunctional UDP-sugar hydrolase/5'-nucleotidase [Halobacillus sp. A5]|uniref:bifunctional metallophosphatase/5'-nucleotidase n=1 Tax=Halobacillus sp. A5 TaxID=2880263 RepID=UPI0020A6954C|nr:5'-nucleotidase C-terminal domain-containing protein [Halobacillus sp. A5]MCP3028524.1 5'-nucleotidase C-terminal domain-containing protein [Halobacillus sp. A5]